MHHVFVAKWRDIIRDSADNISHSNPEKETQPNREKCFFFLFNTKRSCGDSFFPLFTLLISTEGDVSCLDWNTIIDFFDRDGPTKSYRSALLCSPVVSVWDCIVRKMRYSYIPEWV
ncbi:hypothetical protein V6N11_078658 [Hibiscus sabdariffa]|uniref:Uncharacterized protein n=1 Tax=Hibiscus sabdariffa TaxID=183260 RepID=A0ABR2THC0_9ROSI